METPESIVYRGMEGTGQAQIFGREGNPMRAYYMRKADIQRKQAVAAEEAKLLQEKRDKKMWEMINVEPERAYEPFNKQLIDATDSHRKKVLEALEKNPSLAEDQNFQRSVKRGWDEVNDLARRSNYIKQELEATRKEIEKNPYLLSEYYNGKINDTYLNPDGTAKNLDDVDVNSIRNIYKNDPLGFNFLKYEKDYKDGLNDNMTNYVTQAAQNNGILTQDIETKWKGQIYTEDPTNLKGVKTDSDGNPIINDVPEVYESFLNSDTARLAYTALAEKRGVDVKDVVRPVLIKSADLKQDIKPSFSRNPESYNYGAFGLKPWQMQPATNRANKINAIINSIGSDGSLTPEAQSAVGALRNSKFGDGHILDAKIVPGNATPGTTEVFANGGVVTNNASPRLVLRVKYSDRGMAKMEEINLANEGAFESINGLFENSPAEAKNHFSTDQLIGLMGWNPSSIYRGNAGKQQVNEDTKAIENGAVQQWQNGESMETLVGRYADGKKIKSARKIETDGGIFGFGKKHAIEIEFEGQKGGHADIKEIPADDYESLAKIFRGEGAQRTYKFKESYTAKGGKKFTLKELKEKYKYTDEELQKAIDDGTIK
jgi:hypothetical protein